MTHTGANPLSQTEHTAASPAKVWSAQEVREQWLEQKRRSRICPTCESPDPHLHPAMQFEGEIELCIDAFHLIPTSQNRPEYIARVEAKRLALATGSDQ